MLPPLVQGREQKAEDTGLDSYTTVLRGLFTPTEELSKAGPNSCGPSAHRALGNRVFGSDHRKEVRIDCVDVIIGRR